MHPPPSTVMYQLTATWPLVSGVFSGVLLHMHGFGVFLETKQQNILLTYLVLAALGLHCCTQAFSSCSNQGLLLVGRLTVVASLVAEHGL